MMKDDAPSAVSICNQIVKVREWRNEEAHGAQEITDSELRNAVHILVAMYAYVVANTITDL